MTRPLHLVVGSHAQARPDALAVCDERHCLSYARLDRLSNGFAWSLHEAGVSAGDRVALQVDRSARAIVAMLGILKAGAAYVPVDPQQPAQWQAYVLSSAAPRLIVGSSAAGSRDTVIAPPDLEDPAESERYDAAPDTRITGEDPMYVIHTSGSSGEPKGVVVSHGNVARLFPALAEHLRFDHHDIWAQSHSLTFGFSVWEVWGALAHGGLLVIVPTALAMAPARLIEFLAREKVTVLSQTPTAFRQFGRELGADAPSWSLPDLRLIAFSGEALESHVIARWIERFGDHQPLLANLYALTETAGEVAFHRVTRDDLREEQRGTIGRPLSDTRFRLLDPQGLPVPDGETGELYVSGPSVAIGYLDKPELTTERFLADPLATDGTRMYRTGDLARRLADGTYRFMGRGDRQVKIRGYRLELGQVEAALIRHPEVRDAVVLAEPDAHGTARLSAWVVPLSPHQLPDGLRAFLAECLPHYAVPERLTPVDAIPLTANGKLDEPALRASATDRGAKDDTAKAQQDTPAQSTRQIVAGLWREILQIEDIADGDDFFDLGGDSLLTLGLSVRIEEHFAIGVTMADIFENPTLGGIVAHIEGVRARPAALVDAAAVKHPSPAEAAGEHDGFMRVAIEQARIAIEEGQPPYAACIVKDGKVIVSGHNTVWRDEDPTAHAEVRMIREACRLLGTSDLSGCTIYSTAEPCSMCLTACAWANLDYVVYSVDMEDEERYGLSQRTVRAHTMIELLDRPIRLVPYVQRDEMRNVFETWLRIAALG
jgi:amino acid adenylation domain-containing protein